MDDLENAGDFEELHLKANARPEIIAGALTEVIRNLMRAASAKLGYSDPALNAARRTGWKWSVDHDERATPGS